MTVKHDRRNGGKGPRRAKIGSWIERTAARIKGWCKADRKLLVMHMQEAAPIVFVEDSNVAQCIEKISILKEGGMARRHERIAKYPTIGIWKSGKGKRHDPEMCLAAR